jgi:hypothetical protein
VRTIVALTLEVDPNEVLVINGVAELVANGKNACRLAAVVGARYADPPYSVLNCDSNRWNVIS